MKTNITMFAIIDCVSNSFVEFINAANGKQAMQKFRTRMMSTGIYEIIRFGKEWHMLSSFGSDFKAESVVTISGNYIDFVCKKGDTTVVTGKLGEKWYVLKSEKEAKQMYLAKCLEEVYKAIPPALRKRYQ